MYSLSNYHLTMKKIGSLVDTIVAAYKARVLADGGNIDETQANLVNLLNQLNGVVPNFTNSCKLFVAPHLGNKSATGTGATSGNRAANKLYNVFGASGDLVQATAASQPLLLRNTGTNYAYLPGVAGNFISTPNAVANQIYGDFSLQIIINISSLSSVQTIYSKWGGSNILGIDILITGVLLINYHNGASRQVTSAPGFITTGLQTLTITRNSTTGKWFANGVDLGGVAGNLSASTSDINIGSYASTGFQTINGEIFRLRVWSNDSLSGVPNLDFNPNNYNRATSQTSWTSTTGEVWTLNEGSATTGLRVAIVDKTMIMGNGTSYGMQAPSFNLNAGSFTSYKVYRKFNNTVVSIPFELSANAESNSGFYEAINGDANCDAVGARGNVGFNSTVFNSNSLLMKVSTFDWDSSRSNPESLYYINNVAATVNSVGGLANNTGNMNGTGYNWLARNNASSLWANASVFADLIFEGVHNATTRTNVYNILKTYFNLQ